MVNIESIVVVGDGPPLLALIEKESGLLSGRVLIDGDPIADATVEICIYRVSTKYYDTTPCSGQPFIKATTTNSQARFSFKNIPPGRYTITVGFKGQWTRFNHLDYSFTEWVLVEENQETDLGDINLTFEE